MYEILRKLRELVPIKNNSDRQQHDVSYYYYIVLKEVIINFMLLCE